MSFLLSIVTIFVALFSAIYVIHNIFKTRKINIIKILVACILLLICFMFANKVYAWLLVTKFSHLVEQSQLPMFIVKTSKLQDTLHRLILSLSTLVLLLKMYFVRKNYKKEQDSNLGSLQNSDSNR